MFVSNYINIIYIITYINNVCQKTYSFSFNWYISKVH